AARDKKSECFTSFLPAVSKKSIKAIKEKVKACHALETTTVNLVEIANELNPKIRGWFNSYGKFYPSELKLRLRYINHRLMLWARRKATKEPLLFEHWKQGVIP
ncbi:group II intron reverse transcriptase/maturase, partial [Niastella caeni]